MVHYRPRSEGDNVLGRVHLSVHLSDLSWLNRLTYDLDYRPRSEKIIELVASVRPFVRLFVYMFFRALPAARRAHTDGQTDGQTDATKYIISPLRGR